MKLFVDALTYPLVALLIHESRRYLGGRLNYDWVHLLPVEDSVIRSQESEFVEDAGMDVLVQTPVTIPSLGVESAIHGEGVFAEREEAPAGEFRGAVFSQCAVMPVMDINAQREKIDLDLSGEQSQETDRLD